MSFWSNFSTEKENGYLQSGRFREVVTMREFTVVANEISRAGIPLFGLYGDVPLDRVWFFCPKQGVQYLTCLSPKHGQNLS